MSKISQNIARNVDQVGLFTGIYNMCFNKAGLAIGSGSKAKVLIGNTVQFSVNGGAYTKTTAEVSFTATTMDIQANAASVQEACYLYSLQADGTPVVTMGEIATGAGNAVVPATPEDTSAIGYLRLAVAAGSTSFDASTDLLDAAHLTDTYVDLHLNPSDFNATVPTA